VFLLKNRANHHLGESDNVHKIKFVGIDCNTADFNETLDAVVRKRDERGLTHLHFQRFCSKFVMDSSLIFDLKSGPCRLQFLHISEMHEVKPTEKQLLVDLASDLVRLNPGTLEEFRLPHNNLTVEEGEQVLEALLPQQMSSLKVVDLSENTEMWRE